MPNKRKVLITGAAGRIGSFLKPRLADRYDLVLTDNRPIDDPAGAEHSQCDIADLDAMCALCKGIDTVVHLAADYRREAPWESLLPNNIVGVYNIFEAAHRAGCKRVIFASSINAVDGYPADMQVHTDMPVRPPNVYGATKVWGEALGRFYADQKKLSAICLRFGAVAARERIPQIAVDHLSQILTFEDMTKLVIASIEAPDDLSFGIFHGVSDNRWKRLDITDARQVLGYAPEDDAFALHDCEQE